MLKDLSKIEQSPFDGQYDVCVAGSGPAGMTVALKMVETGARVLLLEAGGESYSEQSQAFYQGNSIGSRNYYGVQSCRLRYLGGTSGHWAGRCALFDPIDFEERDIFDLPGWPISYEETYEHLKEALDILDVEGDPLTRDTPAAWESDRMMAVAKGRSTPTRFGEKYRSALQGTENLDVVTHANLTDMTLSEDGTQIIAAEVRGYDNQIYPVKAKYYILAMGALENARFLLNANSQMPTGLGNTHDFVGRCFMEHLDIKLGRFLSTNDAFWQTIEGRGNGKLGLNPHKDVLTRRQLGNSIVTATPGYTPKYYGRLAPFRKLKADITCGNEALLERARRNGKAVLCPGEGAITTLMEQVPNRESRVLLDADAKDASGKPRLNLKWELHDQDLKTIQGLAEEVGKAFAEQDVARFQMAPDISTGKSALGMHCHHMGTTRMSADPRFGVVDRDCKLHGVDNLYLGGSSVFPTGGGANPTLTIVTLALRLSEHLNVKLNSV